MGVLTCPGKTINSAVVGFPMQGSFLLSFNILGTSSCRAFEGCSYLAPVCAVQFKDEYSPFVGINHVGGVFPEV